MASEREPSSNGSDAGSIGAPAHAGGSERRPLSAVAPRLATALAAAAGAILPLACTGPGPGGGGEPAGPGGDTVASATVLRVIDGDTVELDLAGRSERVRLVGIDAPESVSPSVPDQCFGAEASRALHDLLPPGTEVRVERDVEARDRYQRLLLYLHRTDDGLFVNRWMVASGLADAVTFEPNDAFRTDLEAARNEARRTATGLWGSCDGPDQPLN